MTNRNLRHRYPYVVIGLIAMVVLITGFQSFTNGNGSLENSMNPGDKETQRINQSLNGDKELQTEISYSMKKSEQPVTGKGARISPLPVGEMQASWVKTLERLPGAALKGLYSPVNVFGTLMHNPRTMGSFLEYWVTSKLEMGLSPREQELIILRMGVLYNCNYVWKHHLPVAKEYGVNDAELQAVKSTPLPAVFSSREYALLMLTNEMVEFRTIRDDAWSKWSSELKESELIDLVSIVSQYVFFALFNNSLQVEIEEPLTKIPGL